MRDVKQERAGWRDLALSKRHREWGFHCPAVDIDFLMVEYSKKTPVALVEYKGRKLPEGFLSEEPNIIVMYRLGNMAGLPVFVVEYYVDGGATQWMVTAINSIAMKKMDFFGPKMQLPVSRLCNELQYVMFLYHLRGEPIPDGIKRHIIENPFNYGY